MDTYEKYAWFGVFIWLIGHFTLPLFNMQHPTINQAVQLWPIPIVVLILMIVQKAMQHPTLSYIIVAISALFLLYIILVLQFWLALLASLVVMGIFYAVHKSTQNILSFALVALTAIITVAIAGIILGPLLVLIGHLKNPNTPKIHIRYYM